MGQGRNFPDEREYERMLRLQEWGEQGYMEDLDSQMGALDLSDKRPQDVSDKRPQDVFDKRPHDRFFLFICVFGRVLADSHASEMASRRRCR